MQDTLGIDSSYKLQKLPALEFVTTMTKLEQLKERLSVVSDLNGAASLLGWDQQTYMPPGGAAARAIAGAALGGGGAACLGKLNP